MKKLLLSLVFVVSATAVYAVPPTREAPINDQGAVSCLNISTSAWVAVPTTATAGRVGVYVTVLATAAANMAGRLGTSLPTDPASYGSILLKPGLTQFHGISDASLLYLRSQNAGVSAETVCVQEVKQP
jgi:hypothetical protein